MSATPRAPRAPLASSRPAAPAFALAAFLAAAGLAALLPAPARAAAPPKPEAKNVIDPELARIDPRAVLREAKEFEEKQMWESAADRLRILRRGLPPDPDLDLWLSWFEARSGNFVAAESLLAGRALSYAANDSLPETKWQEYSWRHELAWVNGTWDGWHWYVWRTRAEVEAQAGRWENALVAARRATAARPFSGQGWWIRGLCAAQIGRWDEAQECSRTALAMDPILPESHYFAGWLAWRDGRRGPAAESFQRALALDSTYKDAGVAYLRLRIPGSKVEPLSPALLSGLRRAGLLTAPEGPKMESFYQMELAATLASRVDSPALGPTGASGQPQKLLISFLLDAEGRVALVDVPYAKREALDPARLAAVIETLPRWEFNPAVRGGQPHPVWAAQEFTFQP